MSDINFILLLELNKAEQMLADRKISAKDNLGKLIKSGAIRGRERMATGIQQGNKNLEKQNNIKIHHLVTKNPNYKEQTKSQKIISKYTPKFIQKHIPSLQDNNPKQNRKYIPSNINSRAIVKEGPKNSNYNPDSQHEMWVPKIEKGSNQAKFAITRRHENDEIGAGQKQHNKYGKHEYFHFITRKGAKIEYGDHASPEVLKREKKLTDYLSHFDKKTKQFRDDRIESGEYGPKAAGLSSKKINKLINQVHSPQQMSEERRYHRRLVGNLEATSNNYHLKAKETGNDKYHRVADRLSSLSRKLTMNEKLFPKQIDLRD